MTATYTFSIHCDGCTIDAVGARNEGPERLRARLQQAGWETHRVGPGMRDYCPTCAARLRREAVA